MAKITPIDVIRGISGKYGSNTSDYFATNSCSNKIRLAKLNNPYKGPYTEAQLAQQTKFKARAAVATTWLNANRPSTANGDDGTVLYQQAQKLKREHSLSSVTQVLYKYMNAENVISLPTSIVNDDDDSTSSSTDKNAATTKYTLTLAASPAEGGTVTGGGQYEAGSSAAISATAASGYSFTQWSDGNTNASRSVTVSADATLTATFTADSSEGAGDEGFHA